MLVARFVPTLALACACATTALESSPRENPRATPTVAPPLPTSASFTVAPSGSTTVVTPDECAAVPRDMACIPAGEFTRGIEHDPHRCGQSGQPASFASASEPAARIWLDGFYLDKTEVTVAAYRRCVARKACRDVRPLYRDFDAPDQPMTGLSWYDAHGYCGALGRRLPTEAEWEKAARGQDGDATPHGNRAVDCEHAVIKDARGRSCGVKNPGDAELGVVLAVGSRPSGHYGLFDMAGNAEEWVADWWSENYRDCGEACAGRNPAGPCGGSVEPCPRHTFKVVRGGSWYWEGEHATGYHRRRHWPANESPAYHHFGFRCAADATTSEPG